MIVPSALRTGAQALIGFLATYLASHGLDMPVDTQNWFVQTLIVGGGISVYTALVRWLESSTNTQLRLLGRVLMLGLTWQPSYSPPAAARVQRGDGRY